MENVRLGGQGPPYGTPRRNRAAPSVKSSAHENLTGAGKQKAPCSNAPRRLTHNRGAGRRGALGARSGRSRARKAPPTRNAGDVRALFAEPLDSPPRAPRRLRVGWGLEPPRRYARRKGMLTARASGMTLTPAGKFRAGRRSSRREPKTCASLRVGLQPGPDRSERAWPDDRFVSPCCG
jgi:hypothetical protein